MFGLNLQSVHTEAELVLFYKELQRPLSVLPGVESVTVMQERIGAITNFATAVESIPNVLSKYLPMR